MVGLVLLVASSGVIPFISPISSASATPLTESGSVGWSSEADWDNSTNESNVHHGVVPNTDQDDTDSVSLGESYNTPVGSDSLVGFYPLDEDSGSTAVDLAGTANNGTVSSSVRVDVEGVNDGSAYDLNGGDVNLGAPSELNFSGSSGISVFFRVKMDGNDLDGNGHWLIGRGSTSANDVSA